MKRIFILAAYTFCAAMLTFGFQAPNAEAQDTPTLFAVVDYMDVHNVQDYQAVEKAWKNLHQRLVEEGKMVYWGLFSVAIPTSMDLPYSYVTVRLYDDFAKVQNPFPQDLYDEVMGSLNEEDAQAVQKTGASRTIIGSEYFRLTSMARGENVTLGPYLQIALVDTKQENAGMYQQVEEKYWKPMHEERIKREMITGWDVWSKMFSGTHDAYDHVIVTTFNEFGQLAEPGLTEDIVTTVHPEVDEAAWNKIIEETMTSREIVRSGLWYRVDETTPLEQ